MKIDPMGNFEKAFEVWRKVTDDSIARMTAFYAEFDKIEARNLERAESAMHEVTKLTKDTLAYNAQLGAEWRRLSLEALTRASEVPASFASTAVSSARS